MSSHPELIVRSLSHSGTWDLDTGFQTRARLALERARVTQLRCEQLAAALRQTRPNKPGAGQPLRECLDEHRLYTDAAILFSALAIESLLNVYGTIRLGNVYLARFERRPPDFKLAELMKICVGESISADDEPMRLLKLVFTNRNELAHPKNRELGEGDPVVVPRLPLDKAEESVHAMNAFLEAFGQLDPEAHAITSLV